MGTETGWRAVGLSAVHVCGLRADGRIMCWGHADAGELGDGVRRGPQRFAEVVGTEPWASLHAMWLRTCAVGRSGALYCWGDGEWGALGTDESWETVPGRVVP